MDETNPYPRLTQVRDVPDVEIEGGFVRFKTMVTPADVLKYGMLGIPKVFPLTGEHITEDYVAIYLQGAISELEMGGMQLSPIIAHHVDDMHDGFGNTRFFPTLLKKYPVRGIESIELRYPNAVKPNATLLYRIPDHWITFENGKVNIIATTGVLSPTMVAGSTNIPMLNLFQMNYRPMAYRVNYKAGFDQDQLPVIVWQLLIDMATYNMLSELGPLLFPANSVNVQIDSVQQSANLPGPRIFELRLKTLKEKIDKNKMLIAGYYGQSMTVEFAGL